jgi:hypothetical protein
MKALAERNFRRESYSQHTVGHAGHEIFRSNEADDEDPKFALARCAWTIPREVESRLIGESFYFDGQFGTCPWVKPDLEGSLIDVEGFAPSFHLRRHTCDHLPSVRHSTARAPPRPDHRPQPLAGKLEGVTTFSGPCPPVSPSPARTASSSTSPDGGTSPLPHRRRLISWLG